MSLLTTFGILFETDAKEAADDVEKLDKSLEDTEVSAGKATGSIDDVSEAAKSGSQSFNGLAKSLGGLIAAYASWQVVSEGVIGNALAIDQLGKFSETLGLNIQDVDAWGAAVERNGGSAESFRGSVSSLNQALGDIALTGGGDAALTLARLGIAATDSNGRIREVFDILPELADSFQNLSNQEAVAFGQKLGLDQGTILLLQQGRVAVEDLVDRQKQLSGVTKQGYEESAKFNDAWDDTRRSFNSLWQSGNSTILPLLTKVFEGLQVGVEWVKENKTLVTGFFVGVAGVITAVYLPAITAAAAATIAAISPFVLIGAAIVAAGAAIAILYEDIVAFVNGQDSFIGSLIDKYSGFGKALIEVFTAPLRLLAAIGSKLKDTFDGALDFLGFGGDSDIAANTTRAINITSDLNANPLNSGNVSTRNSVVNRQQNVNIGGATINAGGLSSAEASQVVGDNMRNQIAMAAGQLDDGIDY